MTKIIALCGKKRSGKNTSANFIHGHILKEKEVIRNFEITDLGELVVNTAYLDENDQVKEEMGILDLCQQNEMFYGYAEKMIWPHVKLYHFADALKEVCMTMFGLTYDQAYGLDKDSPTKLLWENMPGVITDANFVDKWDNGPDAHGLIQHEAGPMSAREVMQFVGTEIFRRMNNTVWIDLVINQIKIDGPEVAVIADCRFDNEAQAVKDNGGVLINLTRSIMEDSHTSENSLSNTKFDFVIDNRNMTIQESNSHLLSFLRGIL